MWTLQQVAGYLEGEGSFILAQARYPVVKANSVDQDVLEQVVQAVGGTCRGPYGPWASNRQPYFAFAVGGLAALELMIALYPHLGNRRKVAIRSVLDRWEHLGRRT